MTLTPMEILRRSDEIDTLELRCERIDPDDHSVTAYKKSRTLLAELKLMLDRLENDKP